MSKTKSARTTASFCSFTASTRRSGRRARKATWSGARNKRTVRSSSSSLSYEPRMSHVRHAPCGCQITGTGTAANPHQIQFCQLHHRQQGAIAIVLIRLEHLKQAITDRDWTQTEFQFDRVLRSLTKNIQ